MFDAPIFQILGLVYASVGLGILINPEFYKKMIDGFVDSPVNSYFGGAMALIAGYFLVSLSSGWSWGWPLIITIIGWLALIKGVWFFIFPKATIHLVKRMGEKWLTIGGLVALVLGVWFLILGFRAF